jgi:ATP-dependent protease ClpP protease subunit
MQKNLFLIGQINLENAKTFIQELITAKEDKSISKICIYLTSLGGYFYPTLAIYDIILGAEKETAII